MNPSNAQKKLLTIVHQLNDWQALIVLKFIQILQYFPSYSRHGATPNILESLDPLEEFIGAVESGKLAQNIDQDLYE